ncbi:hypothetical protein [Solicola gregarius]|uniref:Uncharacterized protein n=1 Tax=Solicola gregarius TaxID=2908642 RepID=A0AA46YMG9_9ACTN|nr:hypothetical protein [Solicola gregarius]UYM07752.1 hypothetical protein L0C25_11985 [Solicola gregarius]
MSIKLCGDAEFDNCRPRVSRRAKRHLPRQFFPSIDCVYAKVSIKSPAGRELVRRRDRVLELACG